MGIWGAVEGVLADYSTHPNRTVQRINKCELLNEQKEKKIQSRKRIA
jgi:lipocalin